MAGGLLAAIGAPGPSSRQTMNILKLWAANSECVEMPRGLLRARC